MFKLVFSIWGIFVYNCWFCLSYVFCERLRWNRNLKNAIATEWNCCTFHVIHVQIIFIKFIVTNSILSNWLRIGCVAHAMKWQQQPRKLALKIQRVLQSIPWSITYPTIILACHHFFQVSSTSGSLVHETSSRRSPMLNWGGGGSQITVGERRPGGTPPQCNPCSWPDCQGVIAFNYRKHPKEWHGSFHLPVARRFLARVYSWPVDGFL